jgi:hypothetical protein
MFDEIYREFRDKAVELAENGMLTDEEFWDRLGDLHLEALARKSRIKQEMRGNR